MLALALASIVPCIALAANIWGGLFFLWPVAAAWILIRGIRRTNRLGIRVDSIHQQLCIDNWTRTVVIPFSSIKGFGTARLVVMAPRYGPPVYMPSVMRHTGRKVGVGAGKGESLDGPIHAAFVELGGQLGVPVAWKT